MLSLSSQASNNEVRKIQFTGRSTYILSLPKRWMSEMHLKAGDPVSIVREANNSLSILPEIKRATSSNSENEVTSLVMQDEEGSSLKRKVVSMYLAGYNIMHLKSKAGRINPAQREAVRDRAQDDFDIGILKFAEQRKHGKVADALANAVLAEQRPGGAIGAL